jgi:hypothetical protein
LRARDARSEQEEDNDEEPHPSSLPPWQVNVDDGAFV